ncbi:hypothetical protein GCM10023350_08500 [Nocardioides endophyticus]|uniref:Uncharacterized protein n=1 Tax=Nocardioides endophyticus TaxID=1353775 RepID=A0ABP8YFR5_9ACTN
MTHVLSTPRRIIYRVCLRQTYAEYGGTVRSIPAVAYCPATEEDESPRWTPSHETVLAVRGVAL